MKEKSKSTTVKVPTLKLKIEFANQSIHIGHGTVPTSSASIDKTSIQEMKEYLRKASDKEVFKSTNESTS